MCGLVGTFQGLTCMDNAPLFLSSAFLPPAWNMYAVPETLQPSRVMRYQCRGQSGSKEVEHKAGAWIPVAVEP